MLGFLQAFFEFTWRAPLCFMPSYLRSDEVGVMGFAGDKTYRRLPVARDRILLKDAPAMT